MRLSTSSPALALFRSILDHSSEGGLDPGLGVVLTAGLRNENIANQFFLEGPKGSRAKVISELRETQRLAAQKHGSDSAPASPAYLIKPGLLSNEIIDICVTFFFNNLYPTQPILERSKVGEAINRMYEDVEAYVFVVSLCAYVRSIFDVQTEHALIIETKLYVHST